MGRGQNLLRLKHLLFQERRLTQIFLHSGPHSFPCHFCTLAGCSISVKAMQIYLCYSLEGNHQSLSTFFHLACLQPFWIREGNKNEWHHRVFNITCVLWRNGNEHLPTLYQTLLQHSALKSNMAAFFTSWKEETKTLSFKRKADTALAFSFHTWTSSRNVPFFLVS